MKNSLMTNVVEFQIAHSVKNCINIDSTDENTLFDHDNDGISSHSSFDTKSMAPSSTLYESHKAKTQIKINKKKHLKKACSK